MRDDRPGVVYLIEAGDDGPIKIGWTISTESRLRMLQEGSAAKLRLIASTEGHRSDERQLQDLLRDHWIRGDWFRRSALAPAVALIEDRNSRQDAWSDAA